MSQFQREGEVEVLSFAFEELGESLPWDGVEGEDDTPFKTADETWLDELQLLRQAVGGEDDLLSRRCGGC